MFDLLVLFFCAVGFMSGAMVMLEALFEGFRGLWRDIRGE